MERSTRAGSVGPDLGRQYLDEIGTVPLVTKEDEGALARRIEAGRQAAGEVGSELRLTRERVRQLEARALSKLRHPSNQADGRTLLAG